MHDGNQVDVAIIGAGVSGLAVARMLIAGGRSVAVVESRQRVGGRLHSPGGLDLGATWFWPGEHRVAALVDELGIPVHSQHIDGDAVYHDPAGSQRIDGNPLDVPSGRFTNGAQQLAEKLAEKLPDRTLQLGSRAKRVTATTDNLIVHHDRGEIAAGNVVLALPPALAVSQIDFDPPLPDRLAGLAAGTPVWMGAVAKVVATYDQAFWRVAGLAGAAISHFGPLREVHDMSGPGGDPAALFGFVPLAAGDPSPDADQVIAQLVEIFGPDAAAPNGVVVADWRDEPDTSPPGVEQLTAYQTFGHPLYQEPALDGRLHWASTETATVAPGHIEGALAAAERAVGAITIQPTTAPLQEADT